MRVEQRIPHKLLQVSSQDDDKSEFCPDKDGSTKDTVSVMSTLWFHLAENIRGRLVQQTVSYNFLDYMVWETVPNWTRLMVNDLYYLLV